MRRVYALIDRVKDTDVPVLVTGESGTGKEVVARAIHQAGPRAKKPFVGVNCGAIPANLLESELFGHVRGAFTGADRDRKGLFREAEGGTLLLDEIGEMPLKMQAGLLRVLQEKTRAPRRRRAGGAGRRARHRRDATATSSEMVADGTFREDLFYRLHVVEVRVPPLRERVEDIPPLIDHFLSLFAARYRRERKSVSRDALRRALRATLAGQRAAARARAAQRVADERGRRDQRRGPRAARRTRRARRRAGADVGRDAPAPPSDAARRAPRPSRSTATPSASASSARSPRATGTACRPRR